jgi:type II secretory pathway component GspD/PulD (secretin)
MQARNDRNGLRQLITFAGVGILALATTWPTLTGRAQVVMQASPAAPPSASADTARAQAQRMAEAQAQAAAQAQQAAAAKAAPTATPPAEQKPAEAAPAAAAPPATVQRPSAPPKEADPKELDVALNEQNLVPVFNFNGQPWPAVIQWYSKLANSTSDWTELPGDYVNVFTLQPQPLDEVRNLLNRLMLPRGFTIVQRDRTVSVYKIESIDPSMIDMVDELGLYSRKPYDFVKAAFKLPKAMPVDKAKEDLKQVLSPKAKVLPLVTTQQVLVIDAVANLRAVSELLNLERLKEDGKTPLRQFMLKHRRAEDVIDILYVTLGMDPKSKPSQQELQVRQQELQIMQQMAQRGTDVAKMLKPEGPPVFLTFNSQLNSVIANAPEEQMKMIEETIKWLDVPLGGVETGLPATAASLKDDRAMETYKLKTLDPVKFKTTLDDIGDLSPFTIIHADTAGQAILVQGPPADQEKIAQLIKELDGEERQMKMIQLRRRPAEEVAVSIRELIAGESSKNDPAKNDPYAQYLMSMANRNNPPKEDPHKGFYVAADVVNNQLLIKANREEFAQIHNLLRELGEVPDDRSGMAMRVVEPTGSDLLEQIRKAWAQTGGNPLVINDAAKAKDEDAKAKQEEAKKATQPGKDRGVQAAPPVGTAAVFARFAEQQSGAEKAADSPSSPTSEQPPAAASEAQAVAPAANGDDKATTNAPASAATQPGDKPPVSMTVTDDGRIVIRSQDAEAVARLESLIAELSPPPQRFKRFPLVHVASWSVLLSLEEMYAEELEEDGEMIRDWYGRWQQTGKENGTGLAKRPRLKITEDPPTNCILVANASHAQLKEIGELIKDLDQPTPEAVNVRARVTATIKVQHSRASIIATALKEVYVDLLSSRDREFASGEEGRSTASGLRRLTEIRFGDPANGGSGKGPRLPMTFNGQLSVGADDVSNHLLISCDEELFDGIVAMIHRLDEASAPKMSIMVHSVASDVQAESLQKAMTDSVGKPWLGGRPEDQIMTRGGAQQPQGPNQGRGPQPQRGNRGNRGRAGSPR